MNSNDARFIKSHRHLLDQAITLFLAQPEASMSALAKHANVGRATLYRHFENKEALIQALALESLHEMNASTANINAQNSQGRDWLECLLECVIPVANRYHFVFTLWDIAIKNPEVATLYQQQREHLAKQVEAAKALNEINPDLPTAWVVSCIDALISTTWLQIAEGSIDTHAAIALAKTTLFNGIANR